MTLKDVRLMVDLLIDISFLILILAFVTLLVTESSNNAICTPESIKSNCNNDTECVVEVYKTCNTSISFETTLKEKESK